MLFRSPPAYASDRVALEDDSFEGYTFAKGTLIVLYYYGLHRNETLWPNATEFKPDRFLNPEKETTKIFYPFGGGPRLCIGNNFAMAEMALFLQEFIQRFNLSSSGVSPTMKPLLTLRPSGVLLNIERKG